MLRTVFILLFPYILFAIPTVNITSAEFSINDFAVEYFVDTSEKLTLKEVQNQKFSKETNRLSLGRWKNHTWIRFEFKNDTKQKTKIFLHDELAYLNSKLDFYLLAKDSVQNSLHINIQNAQETQEKLYGSDAIFEFNVNANEVKTIYIKSTMSIIQAQYFTIYSEKNSKKSFNAKKNYLIILLGMLLALCLYHFILYLSTGYKKYLYYTLYLVSGLIWELNLTGVLADTYNFYPYEENMYFLLSVFLLPIFLTLFTKQLFSTQQRYPIENFLLNSVISFFTIAFIIAIFKIQLGLSMAPELYIYLFVILLGTTYSIMRKGNKLAFVFLLGNSLFALFTLITDLYYSGIVNYSFFTFNAAVIGILIEAIFLAILLSYKIKLIQKNELKNMQELAHQNKISRLNDILKTKVTEELAKSREKDKILFQQQKRASMGEMIENIAHQWKQPLSQINSSVLVIDNYLDPSNKNYSKIDKHLTDIENLTLYMSRTIESFQHFFDPNKKRTFFSIKECINTSLLIFKNSIDENSIIIEQEMIKNDTIVGFEDELQQVLIIILNNAKDILSYEKTKNPKISISTFATQNNYHIVICDNGKGIEEAIIDKVFDPYFTTKHKSQGTGLGLYIAKLIIEENMFGTLKVSNTDEGACFEILLPNQKSCSLSSEDSIVTFQHSS